MLLGSPTLSAQIPSTTEQNAVLIQQDTVLIDLVIKFQSTFGGTVLPGVAVSLPALGQVGLSDAEGLIVFEGVPVGGVELSASTFGYDPFSGSRLARQGDTLVVMLDPQVIQLEGIDVSGERRRTYAGVLRSRSNRTFSIRSMRGRVLQESPFSETLPLVEGRYGMLAMDLRRKCPMVLVHGTPKMVLFFVDEELVTPEDFRGYAPSDFAILENHSNTLIKGFTPDFLERMHRAGILPSEQFDAGECSGRGVKLRRSKDAPVTLLDTLFVAPMR